MAAADLPADRFAFRLPEVAELTGIPARALQDGCRSGRIPHSLYGRERVMTPEHIRRFLAAHEVTPEAAEPVAEPDEVGKARQRAQQRAARSSRRAAA